MKEIDSHLPCDTLCAKIRLDCVIFTLQFPCPKTRLLEELKLERKEILTKKNNWPSNYTGKSTDDNIPCKEWLMLPACSWGPSTWKFHRRLSWASLSVYVKWDLQSAIVDFEGKKKVCIRTEIPTSRKYRWKRTEETNACGFSFCVEANAVLWEPSSLTFPSLLYMCLEQGSFSSLRFLSLKWRW